MVVILTVFVIFILPLVVAVTSLIVYLMRKVANKKIKFRRVFLGLTIGSYLTLFGDYHLSNIVFYYYCSDKEFVGQIVNERVALPEEMFVDLSKEEDMHKQRYNLFINNRTELINEDKFNELFEYQYYKRTDLFLIGPIYQIETNVKRKADGKILGKAISLNNKLGWIAELNVWWLNSGDSCPVYRDKYGDRMSNSDHATLIDNIFYKK